VSGAEVRELLIALAAGVLAFAVSTLVFILLGGDWRGPGVGATAAGIIVAVYVWYQRRKRREGG
jgi:hypothetical protein